jgi:hypothetical protein
MPAHRPHRFDASVSYKAKITEISENVEPGWQRVRNRMRLVFAVWTSHGPRIAHIYLEFDENWKPSPSSGELLQRLLAPMPTTMDFVRLKANLKNGRYILKFAEPTATGQRQAIVEADCPSPDLVLNRQRNWSTYSITIDVDRSTLEIYESKKIRAFALKDVPKVVKKLLLIFSNKRGGILTANDYDDSIRSDEIEAARERLRKAVGKTKEWLETVDGRRHLDRALIGKPRLGYRLDFRVFVRSFKN